MLNSRFYKVLDEVTTIVIINFLFLVASIPIVTLFPALFAMLSTVRNKLYHKDSEIVRFFFKELWHYKFKANAIGIPILIIGFSLFYYVYAFTIMDSTFSLYVLPLSIVLFTVFFLWASHVFFTLIHFSFSLKQTLTHALLATFYKPLLTCLLFLYVIILLFITFNLQILLFLGTFSLFAYGNIYINLKKLPVNNH